MKAHRIPGYAGILITVLWLLSAVAFAPSAHAENEIAAGARVSDLAPALAAHLVDRGAENGLMLRFDDPDQMIGVDATGAPVIDGASYNSTSGRFVIRMIDATGVGLIAIAGRAEIATRVPALAVALPRGAIIRERDIAWAESIAAPAGMYVHEIADVVGMEARRPLAAGAPLRLADLAAPTLVERGDVVTMIVTAPGLRLTHKGIAREAGAARDIIDIENVTSGRTIRAVVVSEGVVEAAGPAAPRASNRGRS